MFSLVKVVADLQVRGLSRTEPVLRACYELSKSFDASKQCEDHKPQICSELRSETEKVDAKSLVKFLQTLTC